MVCVLFSILHWEKEWNNFFLEYRIARHRREVVEPELIQEKSDSEDERHRKRFGEEEESSEEEEELDEEVQYLSLFAEGKWEW